MRGSALGTLYDAHPGKSLAARGGAMRTFSSMAIFLTLTLLGLGVYIIRAEFANPLAAQSWSLFTAAFILATGVTLLYYLLEARKGRWGRVGREECSRPLLPVSQRSAISALVRGPRSHPPATLVLHPVCSRQ